MCRSPSSLPQNTNQIYFISTWLPQHPVTLPTPVNTVLRYCISTVFILNVKFGSIISTSFYSSTGIHNKQYAILRAHQYGHSLQDGRRGVFFTHSRDFVCSFPMIGSGKLIMFSDYLLWTKTLCIWPSRTAILYTHVFVDTAPIIKNKKTITS